MKAVRIHRFGGPEVLDIETLPDPRPGQGEVLVEVRAASVNPVDYKIRQGKYPMVKQDKLPVVLGRDIAGVVREGSVAGLKPGDEVYAMVSIEHGGYADRTLVAAEELATKPRTLDFVQAASVPLAGLTAWQGLFDQGGLQAGQRVLIHGAAGGVGHFAVQFAKAKGATVFATCSGKDAAFVHGLGADQAIDYKQQRFEDVARDIDLVLDLIAGETQERSWAVLKPGGMLVSTLQKPDPETMKRHNVRGTNFMVHPDRKQLAEIAGLIDAGKVKPQVTEVLPFDQVAKAQTALEQEHLRGKVVLRMAA